MKKTYKIELSSKAQKDIRKLERNIQIGVIRKIKSLSENPCPAGVEKIKGVENAWRVRVGKGRIIYEIHDDTLLIIVIGIPHRSKAYNT